MDSSDGPVDCVETIERIYHYLDGELTDERRRQIQRHLDECPPCVEAYGFETELRQLIANRCRDHVPSELLERIRTALQDEEARRSTAAPTPEG
jgi:mycothiol system anti-sigma-R factor